VPNHFYWDASAPVKRYAPESGTLPVNLLFSRVAPSQMICLSLAIGEVISIFVRKRNDKLITEAVSPQAMADFRAEVLDSAFKLASLEDRLVFASHPLIVKHSLNATDALVLCSAFDVQAASCQAGDDVVLIASDRRLLRAAEAEGLRIFNPETDFAGTARGTYLNRPFTRLTRRHRSC